MADNDLDNNVVVDQRPQRLNLRQDLAALAGSEFGVVDDSVLHFPRRAHAVPSTSEYAAKSFTSYVTTVPSSFARALAISDLCQCLETPLGVPQFTATQDILRNHPDAQCQAVGCTSVSESKEWVMSVVRQNSLLLAHQNQQLHAQARLEEKIDYLIDRTQELDEKVSLKQSWRAN